MKDKNITIFGLGANGSLWRRMSFPKEQFKGILQLLSQKQKQTQ